MHVNAKRFLVAVLGRVGGNALITLAKADPGLDGYLVPRAALAWLGHVEAEIELPGCPGVDVVLRKSQGAYYGSVGIDGAPYVLEGGAEPAHVAAAISCAVGVTPEVHQTLRDRDLAQLGQTIDLLAKAQAKHPDHDGTGKAAAAIAPEAPTPPDPTAPDTTRRKRLQIPLRPKKPAQPPKARTAPLHLAERDTHRPCSVCGASQFKGGKFRGCYCIRSMVKSITTTQQPDGRWDIHLDRLQPDEAALVVELFKGRADGR